MLMGWVGVVFVDYGGVMKKVVVICLVLEIVFELFEFCFEVVVLEEGGVERFGLFVVVLCDVYGVLVLIMEMIGVFEFEVVEKMEVFVNMVVGYNNIDVEVVCECDIVVINILDVLIEMIVDLIWVLFFVVVWWVVELDRFLCVGCFDCWGLLMLLGLDVFGK